MPELKLRDIKPLVEIPDYSLFFLVAIVIVGLFILVLILYFIVKYIKNRDKFNKKKEYLRLLKEVDLSDSKKAAYEITKYAQYFASLKDKSNPQLYKHEEIAHNLIARLSPYKYKKSVLNLDDEVISYYHLFVEVVSE